METGSYIETILKDEKPIDLKAPFLPFPEKDQVVNLSIGKDSTMNVFLPQKTPDIQKYFLSDVKLPRDIRSMIIALLKLLQDYKNLCSSIFDLDALEKILVENKDMRDLRKYVPIYDIEDQILLTPSSLSASSLQTCLTQTDVVVMPLLFMEGSLGQLEKIKSMASEHGSFYSHIMEDVFSKSVNRSQIGELVHVGLLIFFPNEKKATYIDPNGAMMERSVYPNLESQMSKFLQKIGYQYEQAELYCPRFGSLNLLVREIQKTKVVDEVPILRDGGFCLIWTFAMILHIALNPKMKTYNIFQRLNTLLTGRLIPYTLFLLNYFEKYISIV